METRPNWQPALRLNNVDIVRGDRTLIAGLSLALDGAQLLWVEGGNGIGKTSLLRCCAGLSRPDAGRVAWDVAGQTVTAPQAVAFLPADSYAKPGLRVEEDAAFWGADPSAVGLDPHTSTPTDRISTGQAKRLSLAKLLAADKPIWILDEPLAGLDADGRREVAAHIQAHIARGGLALIASHAAIPIEGVKTRRLTLDRASAA